MTVLTEGQWDLEHLVSEASNTRSREPIQLAISATDYESGSVLKLTGTEYEMYDGTGTAAALLMHRVPANTAIADGVAHVRDVEYKIGKLVWFTGASQAQMDAGMADLLTAGMVGRANT